MNWQTIVQDFIIKYSDQIRTALFTLLRLWGLVASLWDIITISFLLKIAIISLMTPFLALTKRYIHPTQRGP